MNIKSNNTKKYEHKSKNCLIKIVIVKVALPRLLSMHIYKIIVACKKTTVRSAKLYS